MRPITRLIKFPVRLGVLALFSVLAAIFITTPCLAEESKPAAAKANPTPPTQTRATEQQHYQRLREIVRLKPFYFQKILARSEAEQQFCAAFWQDLQANKNIQVVEPWARPEDLESPLLVRWRECGEQPQIADPPWQKEGQFEYPTTGSGNFRLYKIDADNNPKNGLEEVMYSDYSQGGGGMTGFRWWDLKRCEAMREAASASNGSRDDNGQGFLADNYAVIVKHKNKTWALIAKSDAQQMHSANDQPTWPYGYYSLSLDSFNGNRTEFACYWMTEKL